MVAPKVASIVAAGVAALAVHVMAGQQRRKKSLDVEDEELENGDVGAPVGVVPVTVAWDGIDCVLRDKRGAVVKHLLHGVSGEAKAGKLLAIMGPSGSGKTTLLNVLAGQLVASPRVRLTGSLTINNRAVSKSNSKRRIAYVRQEDLFFSQLTVRETLSLAAELQLPKTWKSKARERYVQELLYRLGLVSCADTIVGDAKVRGISGGEKKRLSIACELIASPSVIFADEPTTGLDAFQAERVMETLRKLAKEGHTVVCSIHQPRGSIYSKFDDLILLSSGNVVYAGPAQEHALDYFAEMGYNCPEHTNPAEYFADLISVDYSSSENEAATRKKVAELVEKFSSKQKKRSGDDSLMRGHDSDDDVNATQDTVAVNKGGFLWQFRLLLRRAWRQTTRDKSTNRVRGAMSISSAIIFGSIFWRMGNSQTSVQDRMGLLQVAAINTAMAALTKTVNVFPKERSIVQREQAKGSYSLAPYLIAKLVAEAPVSAAFPLVFGAVVYPMTNLNPSIEKFLTFSGIVTAEAFAASAMGLTVGAIAPTTEAALALGPSLMTVFIVFGGYYVNSENTPAIFRWIPRVSLIRWAFQALSINEFKGLRFEAKNSFDLQDGEQVLERLSFGAGSSVKSAVNQELRIALFWYWLTYVLLKRNKAKFQVLEAPPPLPPVSPHHKLTIEELVDE